MFKVTLLLLRTLVSACRNRADLVLEILALGQQLATFALSGRRPCVTSADRWFWIVLRRRWARWSDVLIFVKPETVIRWLIGSVRRELLDHVVIFNERHLRRLLADYVAYYHDDRTHLGLDKATPASRSVAPCPEGDAEVVALPRLGGLHHRYTWRAVA